MVSLDRHARDCRKAFTLIEILAIMAIMIILLSIAVASSVHWGRGARMRSSLRKATASLEMARHWATTQHAATRFTLGTDSDNRSYCALSSSRHGAIGTTNYLAKGIGWSNPVAFLEFNTDGTCDADTELILYEINRRSDPLVSTVMVYRLTGHAKVRP